MITEPVTVYYDNMELHAVVPVDAEELVKNVAHLLPKWKWYVFNEWAEVSGYVGVDRDEKTHIPITAMGDEWAVGVRYTGLVKNVEDPVVVHTHPACDKHGRIKVGFSPPSLWDITTSIDGDGGLQIICEKTGVWVVDAYADQIVSEAEGSAYRNLALSCIDGQQSVETFMRKTSKYQWLTLCHYGWDEVNQMEMEYTGDKTIGVGGAEDTHYEPIQVATEEPVMVTYDLQGFLLGPRGFDDELLLPHLKKWREIMADSTSTMHGVLGKNQKNRIEFTRTDTCVEGMINVIVLPFHDRIQFIDINILGELSAVGAYNCVVVCRYGVWTIDIRDNWDCWNDFIFYCASACAEWRYWHTHRNRVCDDIYWKNKEWGVDLRSWAELEERAYYFNRAKKVNV